MPRSRKSCTKSPNVKKRWTHYTRHTKYYWRANSKNTAGTGNWSGIYTFKTINHPPSIVHLLSPVNHDTLTVSDPFIFKTTKSTDQDADPLTYDFHFIDLDSVVSSNDSATTWSDPRVFERKVVHKWTVSVTDGMAVTASPDTFSFVVRNRKPTVATVTSPDSAAHYLGGQLLVQYQASSDSDNDPIRYIINVAGPNLDTTLATIFTAVPLDSSLFEPSTQYTLSVRPTDGWDTTATAPTTFTTPAATSIDALVDVKSGWNMVSVPVDPDDKRKVSIFPSAVSNAFAYVEGYVTKDSLVLGVGYWLKFSSDQDITVRGTPKDRDTIDVRSGWNMVGGIDSPIPASCVGSIPAGLVVSQFFGYDSGYYVADTIKAGKGYWVKVNAPGKVIFTATMAGKSPVKAPASERPPAQAVIRKL